MIADIFQYLEAADPSLAIALAAAVDSAADDGSVRFGDLALAYRQAYLGIGSDRDNPEARGGLSVDEVRRHLRDSVLPRLASEGLFDAPTGDPDDDSRTAVVPELWSSICADRDGYRNRLLEIAVRLIQSAETDGTTKAEDGALLTATGLTKSYKKRVVVDGVDLTLRQGEIVGLLGPNGAGKTTSFYMMVGLIRPDDGRIVLDGTDLSRMPMYMRARHGIGYLAQEPSVFRKLSVEENVMAVLETMKLSSAERKARLETLLDDLAIKHLRTAKAYGLSGGERRRLEITRALATNPRFMLLDEPFAGVDPIAVNDIQTIVAGLRRRGIGVLITDHNVEQTLEIVDRAYIMFEGKVKVSGSVRDLVFDDDVADVYFGPTLTARLRARLGEAA